MGRGKWKIKEAKWEMAAEMAAKWQVHLSISKIISVNGQSHFVPFHLFKIVGVQRMYCHRKKAPRRFHLGAF